MKKFRCLAVCAFYACFVTDPVASECLNGWTYYEGSCFFAGHSNLDFVEAERFCTRYQAHLATVDSAAKSNFITSFLSDLKDPDHWIGLTDEIVENVWRWQSNNAITDFTNWHPGQPNDHKISNCVVIWARVGYKWIDEPCTNKFRPLCERSSSGETIVG